MRNNKFFLTVLTMALILGLVLAGCDKQADSFSSSTDGGSSGARTAAKPEPKAPPPPPTAEELYGAKPIDPATLKGNVLTTPDGITEIPDDYLGKFFKGKKFDAVVISEGVTKIGDKAFWGPITGGGSIKTVVLPSTLKEIGEYAFSLNSITELYIPDSVTKIGRNAFSKCKISKLTLPKNLKRIEESCFNGNDLKGVVIPEGVTIIEPSAFVSNKNLTTVVWRCGPVDFPKWTGASDLYYGADHGWFNNCAVTEITLPQGQKFIPAGIYARNNIKNAVIPEGVTTASFDCLFDNPIENITFPAGFKLVYMGAFAPKNLKSPSIKTVTLPDNVMNEGDPQLSAGATAALGVLIMGPVGLLGGMLNTNKGQTHLPGDLMNLYYGMYNRKGGVYTYKGDNNWDRKDL